MAELCREESYTFLESIRLTKLECLRCHVRCGSCLKCVHSKSSYFRKSCWWWR